MTGLELIAHLAGSTVLLLVVLLFVLGWRAEVRTDDELHEAARQERRTRRLARYSGEDES